MTQTGARALEGAEQALSPLRRQDLPSFLVALPGGRILEATNACAVLGIHAGALAPAAVRADALRLRGAARFGFARLRLPGLFTPRLFRCAPLALPGGMAVLFADPAAFAADAGTPPAAAAAGAALGAHLAPPSGAPLGARLVAPPVPVALRPLFAQPVRITFETDAAGHLVSLSPLLADALGTRAALFTGRSFAAIEADGLMDGGAALAEALAGGSFSELKAHVAPRTAEETALDLTLGGVPVFDAARRRTGTRGFGILSAALAPPQPPARPQPARAPAPAARPPAELGENVVPLRAGTLSPQERSAFREIARTLAAAIEDWPRPAPAGTPPASDPDAAGTPRPLPSAAEAEDEAPAPLAAPDADGAAEAGPFDFELLDRLPLGLMVLQDGHARFINRTLLDWTGHADLADAEDAGGLDAMLVREGADLLLIAADGGRRAVDVRLVAAPFLGRPALLHVIRPQAEGQNRQDRAAARREAIDMVPWPVFLLEPEGAIRLANAAAAARIGFEAADLAGEPFTIAVAPQDRAAAVAALDAAAGGAPSADLRLTLRHRDGTLFPGRAGVTRAGADGQLLCVVIGPEAQAAHVTPAPAPDGLPHVARRLNAALAAPLERLAAADCPPQEAREARASLAATLDDLARLGADAPADPPAPCDLAALVREAADQLAPAARRRRVALRRDLADSLPVTADAPRLARLVRLLVEDALDATPAGAGIALSLTHEAGGALLQVSDGGAALDEVALAAALDPARDAADASRFDAAGRPLRLARLARDAASLGGRLSVRPDRTRGMVVHLYLPG